MKIWHGFGSEHSYDLVLVGHFVDESSAREAEFHFNQATEIASTKLSEASWDHTDSELLDEWIAFGKELGIYDLSRDDLDSFRYEHNVKRSGSSLKVTTDEGEIQGLIKVMLFHGARLEVYSAHNWDEDGAPRPRATESEGS